MVTDVPGVPIVGVKFVIVGAPTEPETVNAAALDAEPPGVVTLMMPEVAPDGTVTTS
jgi:hypothetical protein